MIIVPYSFNGTRLNSTDYDTSIPRSSANSQITSNVTYTQRDGMAYQVYTDKMPNTATITLEILLQHDYTKLQEDVNNLFNVWDDTPRKLVIEDYDDYVTSDAAYKKYYVYATTKQVLAGHDGNMTTITLAVDDPIWVSNTEYSKTWTVSDTDMSEVVTVGGNIETYPEIDITVTAYPSDVQYSRDVLYIPQSSSDDWLNRPLNIASDTAIGIDTAALVTGSKVDAVGDNFKIFVNGREVDRWFGKSGWNTTDTSVWININEGTNAKLNLRYAYASTDTESFDFVYGNNANIKSEFDKLPNSGVLFVGSEEISYTGKYVVPGNNATARLYVSGLTRGVRSTTAASQSENAVIQEVPYDIKIVYASTDVGLQTIDDNYKPIIDLSVSHNSFFRYWDFGNKNGKRTGKWNVTVKKDYPNATSTDINYFTSTYLLTTDAFSFSSTDNYQVAGGYMQTYKYNNQWQNNGGEISWTIYTGNSISNASLYYNIYVSDTNTSSVENVCFNTSTDGTNYINGYKKSITAPASANTWEAGSKTLSSYDVVPGAKHLLARTKGSLASGAQRRLAFCLTSADIYLTNAPTITVRAEEFSYISNDVISNSAVPEKVTIRYPIKINNTVEIDTNPDFPTAYYEGINIRNAITVIPQHGTWMRLMPGDNTITYTPRLNGGTYSLTVRWRDRMNML